MPTYPTFTPPWQRETLPTGRRTADNPYETVANEKSPQVATRLDDLFKEWDSLRGSGPDALGRYTSALTGNTPRLRAQTESDLALADRIMAGGGAADMAAIRARRGEAVRGALTQAQKGLRRALSLDQLSQGGGGRSLGIGSYLARLALNKGADLNARAATDLADQERSDYETDQRMRLGLTGQRQGLLDRLAGRELLPYQARVEQFDQLTKFLAQLLSEQGANTFFGLRKPFGA